MKKITVLLVDDHEIFRDGIEMLLHLQPHIDLQGSLPNARKLQEYLKCHPLPDVLILDINLPKTSGIELAKELTKEFKQVKTIFLTSNSAKTFLDAALRTGAKGFLTKECSKDELVNAIESVDSGQYFFGREIEQSLYEGYVHQLQVANEESELTDREVEVLRFFANGSTYQEVAEELSISKKTVEGHKKAIYEKLQLKNQTELVKYAIKHHIIEL
ncbi:MAG: response regulator transcription factor [Bacteroidota bacterium]